MDWVVKEFNMLSIDELYDSLKLRAEVFVVEQTCIYNDVDGLDKLALHVIGKENEEVVAYARLLPENTRFKTASIGRVVTDAKCRGQNLGKKLMESSISAVKDNYGVNVITISAQEHLKKFYGDLGFKKASDVYMEDGIPHIKMTMKL